ncbi:glycine cleavage system protein H [Synechococcus sp. 65AY6Li]|uniref:Glycine cleavage system H protein n=1 Tax=Synechococcus sp. (strain JA-3-3Ab) TaxID=321327 RepID=GCSH_SYNJA|nr:MULTISPECIES: glycine cleavage system protein GcvH [unclassified Synechococcus]Q2JX00.1 RecName: Full=Glycine cleavage system H protein [Synechococcus sp. JA-3-3Ab]ABC98700.1 glycine cleavage system H protein [Synechococcus sp. JA-3-3Ab]PIK91187.1 glycine cleavage system protein H [Synechococcus sp. 65AY6Li]
MALEYPPHLRYVDTHEYIRVEDDIAVIGITAYAVDQLGDIVFVGLPEEGTEIEKGESFGSVESVKAVEDLYAPVSGKVVAVNKAVVDSPESIADDPYGDGWLIKVRMTNPEDLDDTMSAEAYASLVEGS